MIIVICDLDPNHGNNTTWMVAKSRSPVDGQHPIIHQLIDGLSHCLKVFNHPFGGAGFRNHPRRISAHPIHPIVKLAPAWNVSNRVAEPTGRAWPVATNPIP